MPELTDLARSVERAHRTSPSKCTASGDEVCSYYRGAFAVMVREHRAHQSEWPKFIIEVRKLQRGR